jgi:hypothetical protein
VPKGRGENERKKRRVKGGGRRREERVIREVNGCNSSSIYLAVGWTLDNHGIIGSNFHSTHFVLSWEHKKCVECRRRLLCGGKTLFPFPPPTVALAFVSTSFLKTLSAHLRHFPSFVICWPIFIWMGFWAGGN